MPKVYDKDGRELTVGDRVQRRFGDRGYGLEGNFAGLSGDHRDVCVEWDHPVQRPLVGFLSVVRRFPFVRAFTCPDLQLIDQPNPYTKEAASAAPEGADR